MISQTGPPPGMRLSCFLTQPQVDFFNQFWCVVAKPKDNEKHVPYAPKHTPFNLLLSIPQCI